MLYHIYFSPTGGTKKVMERISSAWEGPPQGIDLSDPEEDFARYHFQPGDICLVAIPSFGGRAPGVALERLEQMSGGNAKAVLICSYGNRAFDDTLLELEDCLVRRQFRCAAAVAAVTEHSIMRQYGKGRPDEGDRQKLREFGRQIRERLSQGDILTAVPVPGNWPYQDYGGVPFVPKAGRDCTHCGLCAQKCPVKAIDPENVTGTDKRKCISCMQCISICPKHARKLNDALLFAASQKMKKVCLSRKENYLFLGDRESEGGMD